MRTLGIWIIAVTATSSVAMAADPLARVTVEPSEGPFVAASRRDFKLTCVLAQRLEAGSEIRVLTPREGGWSQPSLDPAKEEMPGAFGLVTYRLAAKDSTARLVGKPEKYSDRGPPYGERDRVSQFVMRLESGALDAGDTIEVAFPNTRVSNRALQRDPSRNRTGYRLQIKPVGEKDWKEVEGLPRYQILPAEPAALELRGKSQVVRDEPFPIILHVRDQFQNPVHSFTGQVTLKCSDEAAVLPTTVSFTTEWQGVVDVQGIRLRTPGVHTLTATAPQFAATWSIEVLAEAPALRLYWGELHSHGALSYDARNWGGCTMRPADMFCYARCTQNLDFAAVTDHSMHNSGPMRQQNMTEEEFREIQAAAKTLNEDGRFVTFAAVEQRCARGDTNVFFLRDNEAWYMKDGPITIQRLWVFYRRAGIFTIPHLHPAIRNPERFDEIDPDKERLIEIHSNHGRYEFHENRPLFPKKGMIEGSNVQAVLARGHRLGIVAASDDHSGRPGSADLTAVYAPQLTREALFAAIRDRHTYGTTGPRMTIEFRLGDRIMGDDIRVKAADVLWQARGFSVRVLGTERLRLLEVVRNTKVVYSTEPMAAEARFEYTDMEPLAQTWLGTEKNNPPTTYYYLRVTQQPEGPTAPQRLHMAWTSPIFLSPAQ